MSSSTIKSWLTRGEFEKLEHILLDGRGARLLGEHSPDLRTRVFLKNIPNYLNKISQVHEAATRGSLAEVKKIISDEPKKKLAIAKDAAGTPLIHKAVYHDHQDIIEWLLDNYPNTAAQRDREGRTALHYCGACKDPEFIWDLLIEGGCDASTCDKRGHPAAYYLEHTSEIELPDPDAMVERASNDGKNDNLDFKPSNIRIWIHNRDIAKLQRVLWEGHGSKLTCEISNNPRVRKFLEATPYIMGTIKNIHNAVIKNDLNDFLEKISDPVAAVVLCSKDSKGSNVLHKAAGFGFMDIAREIVERYPTATVAQNNEGKTPLHYGAALKDNGAMYDLLVEYGADESKLDYRNKSAAFYKNRPGDIDLTSLMIIPEAPRVSGSIYPKNWDWRILESDGMRLKSMKKRHPDVDSAFGSAESALKSEESMESFIGMKTNDEELETPGAEEEEEASPDDAVEPDGANEEVTEDADQEEAGDEEEKAEAEDEEGEAEGEKEEEEEKEAEVEAEGEEETEEEKAEEEEEKDGEQDEENVEETENGNEDENADNNEETQEDEKNEPSTGDSGLDESKTEEEQVIADEHEELPEADLNDGSMPYDSEVEDLLVNGNMEQLAAIVLNGDGKRLVGRHSSNPELQAFIDNVPSYIGKIHAVHVAAREGNLKDLQSALDRRKFAIARDGSSPHGATPLHVAIIFGHTAIIRYLAGRFPETAHAIDIDGRTPLHYAATLADNGHYYNLLLHLGGNPLTLDNFNEKADYYKEIQDDFSHRQLLRDFGTREELADEMLTDKDEQEMETPIFREEEGRYLASSLGDPLIKGLTEVAQTRPKDPLTYLATFLYNFASRIKSGESAQSDVLIIPERPQEDVGEDVEEVENPDNDPGYPRSPESRSSEADVQELAFPSTRRDEHGQSMLHFAAVRTPLKDGLYYMLQETQINVGFRDELYRTARDVAEESNYRENAEDIDRFVVYLAARGETEKLVELLLEGYDHILDAEDAGINIVDVAAERNREATVQFLQSIPTFLAQREEVHRAIRVGDFSTAREIFSKYGGGGKLLAVGKNILGRCALHIAVLGEHIEIVQFLADTYSETLKIGDNLERTALHYAMGVPSVEIMSSILIAAGAQRVKKDLKSRQPSYYFMNKSDIQRLQEEEQTSANK